MVFCIFEDRDKATEVKIHHESCGHANRKNITSTTKWHRRINDYETAQRKATQIAERTNQSWRLAKCCRNRISASR